MRESRQKCWSIRNDEVSLTNFKLLSEEQSLYIIQEMRVKAMVWIFETHIDEDLVLMRYIFNTRNKSALRTRLCHEQMYSPVLWPHMRSLENRWVVQKTF